MGKQIRKRRGRKESQLTPKKHLVGNEMIGLFEEDLVLDDDAEDEI